MIDKGDLLKPYLGDSGDRRGPLSALAHLDIFPNPSTISRLRSGDTNGAKIARKLAIAMVLREGDASKKDYFFMEIAGTGLEVRTRDSRDSSRWNSNGFTELIAERLKVEPRVLRLCLRAMRADFVLTELLEGTSLVAKLYAQASEYFDSYIDGHSCFSRVLSRMRDQWMDGTARGFYRGLYKELGVSSLKTWPPYELEVLDAFYRQRVFLSKSSLTLLDRLVLATELRDRPETHLADFIRDGTGIKFDPDVTYTHLNTILYGRP